MQRAHTNLWVNATDRLGNDTNESLLGGDTGACDQWPGAW